MSFIRRNVLGLSLAALIGWTALSAPAQQQEKPEDSTPTNWFIGGNTPKAVPAEAKSVNIEEHLNAKIPLDLHFSDEAGQPVTLGQYFGGKKPVVLQMGYFGCPMLCNLVSQGLVDSLKEMKLTAGKDYEVVYVSIDPAEGPGMAKAKKEAYLQAYGREGAASGWHLLTGQKPQIDQLAQAVGFGYKWIDAAQQYSHPACLMVGTPDGRISRYLYGVRYDPPTVRLSLVEASDGKIGTTADRFILTCFQYDGTTGKYAMVAVSLMKMGGLVAMFAVAGMVFWFARRDPHRRLEPPTKNKIGE